MTSSNRRAAFTAALAFACAAAEPTRVAGAATWGSLPASLRLGFGFGFTTPGVEDKLTSRAAAVAVTQSQDGEDFASAKPIASLPFEDLGTTCGFANDLETECTFLGGAPDVVYRYTPATDAVVDVDVCDNSYDAALHVYRAPGIPVDCNDDACGRGPRIAGLALQAGETYYFVLDGWYGACGGYRLSIVTDPAPCPLDLPASAVPEGEPACADDVYDRFNAGCNDFPYSFRRLDCNAEDIVVSGSYGTFDYYADEFRDTDWYEIVVPVPGVLGAEVLGAAATELAILDGRNGCGDYGPICGSVYSEPCQPLECETIVEPGTYWIFVATRWYTGIRCPTAYRLSVRGAPCGTVPVARPSWSRLKSLYR